jgi:hypothetical protein
MNVSFLKKLISLPINNLGMQIKFLLLFILFFWAVYEGFSQEDIEETSHITNELILLIQDKSDGGVVQIRQNPSLTALLEKNIRINEKEGLEGFRIQLFSGSDQNARDKANEITQEFMSTFPEFNPSLIYTEYQAPYFKLRIGDYRNKGEAYEFFHNVRKKFPNSYIVKSKIKFPKFESVEK